MAGISYNLLDGVPESNAGPFVLPAEAGHLSNVTDENQKFVPVCQRPLGLQRYGILFVSGGKGSGFGRKGSS